MKDISNTDYRGLRRNADGFSTIETVASETQRAKKGTLCERCCRAHHCSDLHAVNTANLEKVVEVSVTACSRLQPGIKFVDTIGTDGLFNTMRFGTAWFDRLEVKQLVGLVDGNGKIYGEAKVKAVRILAAEDALQRHAHKNHMMIGARRTKAECAERLRKILRNVYGKIVFENAEYITVIDLERF